MALLCPFVQVEWLRERIAQIPIRLVFESALELMGCTQVGCALRCKPVVVRLVSCILNASLSPMQIGSFNMAPNPSGEKKGPPPIVKKVSDVWGLTLVNCKEDLVWFDSGSRSQLLIYC